MSLKFAFQVFLAGRNFKHTTQVNMIERVCFFTLGAN